MKALERVLGRQGAYTISYYEGPRESARQARWTYYMKALEI
jgi:hypothetical protein